MKPVKILWLYDELLDLYGDCGNLLVLKKRIEQLGGGCEILRSGAGEEHPFAEADMFYIGPGKYTNLCRAGEDILQYRASVRAFIESGKPALVTGNARFLLGESYAEEGGYDHPGLSLFPYRGVETGDVFVSDVVASAKIEGSPVCYGFINRTGYIDGNESMFLFDVEYGQAECGSGEGNLYKNLFATGLLGPVLVKNPYLCAAVLRRLLGSDFAPYDDTLAQKAHALTVAEFPVSL